MHEYNNDFILCINLVRVCVPVNNDLSFSCNEQMSLILMRTFQFISLSDSEANEETLRKREDGGDLMRRVKPPTHLIKWPNCPLIRFLSLLWESLTSSLNQLMQWINDEHINCLSDMDNSSNALFSSLAGLHMTTGQPLERERDPRVIFHFLHVW